MSPAQPQRPSDRLPDLLEDLALLLLHGGDAEGAHRLWEGLRELAGDAPATLMVGGLIAFAEGRYSDAETLYRQVLALRPGEIGARCFLAEALIAQRRVADAEAVLASVEALTTEGTARRGGAGEHRFVLALRQGIDNGLFRHAGALGAARNLEPR